MRCRCRTRWSGDIARAGRGGSGYARRRGSRCRNPGSNENYQI
jgi:hypothetical protein